MSLQSGIQGFYDPVPSLAKSLRVRYEFRGHMHYAEIPDYIPVVLPLEGMFIIISENGVYVDVNCAWIICRSYCFIKLLIVQLQY